jgi:hypothetical protein
VWHSIVIDIALIDEPVLMSTRCDPTLRTSRDRDERRQAECLAAEAREASGREGIGKHQIQILRLMARK